MKTIDFALAKSKHLSWKTLLRSFLDGRGGLTDSQVVSCRECQLGKWLYKEGLKKYSEVPEMKELESVHGKLHEAVKRVYESKKAGKTTDSEKAFAEMEQLSSKVVNLLTAIEAKVDLAGTSHI